MMFARRAAFGALALLFTATSPSLACRWREPARTYPASERWNCAAFRWADGDTLTVDCEGQAQAIRVRLRGVDTVERGDPRWSASRSELRSRTEAVALIVLPHHLSHERVVADVIARGVNVGLSMDAEGWSKDVCPRK
jgi:endonuclease YncB( thermonuclease family)